MFWTQKEPKSKIEIFDLEYHGYPLSMFSLEAGFGSSLVGPNSQDPGFFGFWALSRSIRGVRRSYFTRMEVPGVLSKKYRIFVGGSILGGSYPQNGLKNASIDQYPRSGPGLGIPDLEVFPTVLGRFLELAAHIWHAEGGLGCFSEKLKIFSKFRFWGVFYPKKHQNLTILTQAYQTKASMTNLGFGGFSHRSRPVFGVSSPYLARRGGIGLLFEKNKNFPEISILGGILSQKTSKFDHFDPKQANRPETHHFGVLEGFLGRFLELACHIWHAEGGLGCFSEKLKISTKFRFWALKTSKFAELFWQ